MARRKGIQIGEITYETLPLACRFEEIPLATLRNKIKESNNDPYLLKELINKTKHIVFDNGKSFSNINAISEETDIPVAQIRSYIKKNNTKNPDKPLSYKKLMKLKDTEYAPRKGHTAKSLIVLNTEYGSIVEAANAYNMNVSYLYHLIAKYNKEEVWPNKEIDQQILKRIETGSDNKSIGVFYKGKQYFSLASLAREYHLSENKVRKYYKQYKDDPELFEKIIESEAPHVYKLHNKVLCSHKGIAEELKCGVSEVKHILKIADDQGMELDQAYDLYESTKREDIKNILVFGRYFDTVSQMSKMLSISRATLGKWIQDYGKEPKELENVINNYRFGLYKKYADCEFNGKIYSSIFEAASQLNRPVKELIEVLENAKKKL